MRFATRNFQPQPDSPRQHPIFDQLFMVREFLKTLVLLLPWLDEIQSRYIEGSP